MWTVETQLKGFQRGTILATNVELILVLSYQRLYLFSDLALRSCLKLKIID